ncbi:MAG: cytochrome P450 [Acidimicrobiia bacterium]
MTSAPATPEPLTLNPFEPGFFDNPYEQYRLLREDDPVRPALVAGWMLFRYDDIVRLLRDPALSVEDENVTETSPRNELVAELMGDREPRGRRAILNLDPPDHDRIRRLVSYAFTPKRIQAMRPQVEQLVTEALDAVAGQGAMDVIADLAFPLPFQVISEMLGMPAGADRDRLRAWSSALVRTLEPIIGPDDIAGAVAASDAMNDYVRDVLEWKRKEPGDDLLSAMIEAEEGGDRLTDEELRDQVVLLYIAGHETTVNLIGNGTLALLRNPGQLLRLRGEPALDQNAIEELLRYDSPVQFSRRITLQPVEIGGHEIEAGSLVLTCLGAANHDPEHWGATADDLDLGRDGAALHVSFGSGIHHCLGAALARVEGQCAIPALVRRFPDLDLATDAPEWNGRIVLRGLQRLPVSF